MIEHKTKRQLLNARYRLRGRIFDYILGAYAKRSGQDELTQKELAQEWGKDEAQVSRMLRSPRNLTLDTVGEFLELLDIELGLFEIDLREATRSSITNLDDHAKKVVDGKFLQGEPATTSTSPTYPVKIGDFG